MSLAALSPSFVTRSVDETISEKTIVACSAGSGSSIGRSISKGFFGSLSPRNSTMSFTISYVSPYHGRWNFPFNTLKHALGISLANCLPCLIEIALSPSRCKIKVGIEMLERISVTSNE